MVMTPTEASVQNQRLPKGYAYVPVGVLPKGKVSAQEASALKDQWYPLQARNGGHPMPIDFFNLHIFGVLFSDLVKLSLAPPCSLNILIVPPRVE